MTSIIRRERELLRARSLIGPFEAALGELLDLAMIGERRAVDGDDKVIHGATAFVDFHGHTTLAATARPAARPEKMQPPRNVPSSAA